GVPAEPATGLLPNYQVQIYASNLWHEGDFNVLTLQHGDTQIGRLDSISATLRFPLGGAWRLAPRLSIERLSGLSDGSKETSYLPSALLDYQRGNTLLQLEFGGQLGSRGALPPRPAGTVGADSEHKELLRQPVVPHQLQPLIRHELPRRP